MNLNEFIKGWIVGDFNPSIIRTKDIEVGIKKYFIGDKESTHVHNFVDEYTIVVSGKIKMNDIIYSENEIAVVKKTIPNKFECLEDAVIVVIKSSSYPQDKIILE